MQVMLVRTVAGSIASNPPRTPYSRKNSTSSRPVPYPPAMMIDWKTSPGSR